MLDTKMYLYMNLALDTNYQKHYFTLKKNSIYICITSVALMSSTRSIVVYYRRQKIKVRTSEFMRKDVMIKEDSMNPFYIGKLHTPNRY